MYEAIFSLIGTEHAFTKTALKMIAKCEELIQEVRIILILMFLIIIVVDVAIAQPDVDIGDLATLTFIAWLFYPDQTWFLYDRDKPGFCMMGTSAMKVKAVTVSRVRSFLSNFYFFTK